MIPGQRGQSVPLKGTQRAAYRTAADRKPYRQRFLREMLGRDKPVVQNCLPDLIANRIDQRAPTGTTQTGCRS